MYVSIENLHTPYKSLESPNVSPGTYNIYLNYSTCFRWELTHSEQNSQQKNE